jgi:hypothetical protein
MNNILIPIYKEHNTRMFSIPLNVFTTFYYNRGLDHTYRVTIKIKNFLKYR